MFIDMYLCFKVGKFENDHRFFVEQQKYKVTHDI